MTKRKLKQLLAKEREFNAEYKAALKEATAVAEKAAKRHKRHVRLVNKLYRKLGQANRQLEVANEYVELLTQHVRHANQWMAESTTAAEKRTFQNVTSTKALESHLKQLGYSMEMDDNTRKMLEAVEGPEQNGNGKPKRFMRG